MALLEGALPDLTAVHLAVGAVGTAVVWAGSAWLETSAEDLSAHYGLPPVVQGSVVVAVGSSVPEFASVVVTALGGVFGMGVGAVVGSAIFNILVIPALAGLSTPEPLEADRSVVYKEAQFYMLAVSVLVITFALAVIYEPVGDAAALEGLVTRPIAAIPLGLYGLYLFIQWQDVGDHEALAPPAGVDVRRQWLRLVAGLSFIVAGVELLVGSIDALASTFGVPEFLAGVTVLAVATSLPDTLVSVRTARDARGLTSLGNVLGSNTFDLLVAIPVGVLIVGSVPVDFAVAVPMFAVLTLATVLLFAMLRTDLTLTRFESVALFACYAVFVGWVVAETVGATSLLRGG